MKAINFINWKYIGLTGCLVASLLTACGDDETGPEVVTQLEPKLERSVHLQFFFCGKFRSSVDIQCQSGLAYRTG